MVEQCHSVRVLNHGTDLGFFQLRIDVSLFSFGVGLFLIMCYRMVHALPPSFMLPILISHCKIDQ